MTFVEEKKDPNKLSLWRNTANNLLIEIEPDGNDDGMLYQCIELELEDAIALCEELRNIIAAIKADTPTEQGQQTLFTQTKRIAS
jgi:hypothetical protein